MHNTEYPRQLLEPVRAVSFDLDDTLWHCEPAIRYAEAQLFHWLERETPRITARHTEESLLAYRMQIHAANPDLHCDVTLLRKLGLRTLLEQFDYPAELAEEAFSVFFAARSEVVLYDGALSLLEKLASRYRLAAITNGNADLQRIGIAGYFDEIQAASIERAPKPDPAMFREVIDGFGIRSAELLHVGDNPVADVQGGHNAGALTVWFNQFNDDWPLELRRAQFEVLSLTELSELLIGG